MSNSQIIRLENNGPMGVGLTSMDLDPDDFQSELPEQYWHLYYENEEIGLTVGVWTTTTMQEAFGPYPGDEFMCILEGQVAMVAEDGSEKLIKSGETFCVKNGTATSWKQIGFLRKFFMTYSPPEGGDVKATPAADGISVLKQEELSDKLQPLETVFPFEIEGNPPAQKDAPVFVNETNNMHVGMWESAPFESLMKPFPCNEFVQLLKGKITITEQSGESHTFVAGDVFFVPEGTVCSWKADGPVRKFYCMFLTTTTQGEV